MRTLTLYRPNSILNDFERYFESFFGDAAGDSVSASAARAFKRFPEADIRETENSYLLDMELPGFNEKDIEVNVDGGNLSVASKKDDQQENASTGDKDSIGDKSSTGADSSEKAEGTWLLRERHVNSFCRSFRLPENADSAEISAEFKNGVLRVEIKKRAEAQKRAIRIDVK
jgi:HSP20 family protein